MVRTLKPTKIPAPRTYEHATLNEIVAANLKSWRKKEKLTQQALVDSLNRAAVAHRADAVALTASMYSRMESGVTPVTLEVLDRCAARYEIAPSVLLVPKKKPIATEKRTCSGCGFQAEVFFDCEDCGAETCTSCTSGKGVACESCEEVKE